MGNFLPRPPSTDTFSHFARFVVKSTRNFLFAFPDFVLFVRCRIQEIAVIYRQVEEFNQLNPLRLFIILLFFLFDQLFFLLSTFSRETGPVFAGLVFFFVRECQHAQKNLP